MRQIAEVEGFDVIVTQNGNHVDPKLNGVLGPYPYRKKLKHSCTVSDWRRERFEATYPGYSCIVLEEDGTQATGQKSLRAVRETYEED
jgi:hypothetical protein